MASKRPTERAPKSEAAAPRSDAGAAPALRGHAPGDDWRHTNFGRLLNSALRRFEIRVLDLMKDAGHSETRLSHVNLTRNLDRTGTRVTELARRSAMTKQAMGELVDQCEALGLVERVPDPADGRARTIRFTRAGTQWLDDFRKAVDQVEQEMRAEIGAAKLESVRSALVQYGAAHDELAYDADDAASVKASPKRRRQPSRAAAPRASRTTKSPAS